MTRSKTKLVNSPLNSRLRLLPQFALALLALVLLSACPNSSRQRDLDDVLLEYETLVRWSEWDAAIGHIDSKYLLEHPVSTLDMDRLRLFKVTKYTVRAASPIDEGNGYLQTVEIRLYNRNNAIEKSVMDQQIWRLNEETGQWKLHSGLPDPTKTR